MSIFKQLGGAAKTPSERFFGVVQGYEPDAEGNADSIVRIKTLEGAERKVALYANSKIKNLKEGFERPPISTLAGKGRKGVAVGGTVLIEDAFLDRKTQVHMAKWVSAAVHKPGDGFVIDAKAARVSPLLTSEAGKTYRTVDVLDIAGAKSVKDVAAFEAAVADAVRGHGAALVRFANSADGSVGSKLITGGRSDLPAEERIAAAKGKEQFTQIRDALAKGIEATDVVEVVPAQRLFFGSESATTARYDKIFTKTSNDGTKQFSKGYTDTLISLQTREDGSGFVTHVLPKSWESKFTPVGEWPALEGKAMTAASDASEELEADDDLPPDMDLDELAGEQKRAAGMGM